MVVPILKMVGLSQGMLIWASLNMLSGWAVSRSAALSNFLHRLVETKFSCMSYLGFSRHLKYMCAVLGKIEKRNKPSFKAFTLTECSMFLYKQAVAFDVQCNSSVKREVSSLARSEIITCCCHQAIK